jgi:galactose mutarotase-like enzyme
MVINMQYLIKNDKLAVRFDTKGGQIVSMKDSEGLEYLWQGDAAYWSGQAPIMFPICGSIRDKKATVGNGKTCNMERHGIVRKSEFKYLGQTVDSITFSICPDDEMKVRYPYDFELRITYVLNGKTLTNSFQVFNRSNEPMPYFIGGHPGFNCPLLPGEQFEDYVVEFEKTETASCPESIPATGLVNVDNRLQVLNNEAVFALKHNYFDVDALIFDRLKSRSAKLINPKTGKGVQVDFAGFDYFILWSSPNGGPLSLWNHGPAYLPATTNPMYWKIKEVSKYFLPVNLLCIPSILPYYKPGYIIIRHFQRTSFIER